MCFSPTASFFASIGLATLGVQTLRIAEKKEKILAAAPLMFALQQGIEGVQWLALGHGQANMIIGYAFLFFALLVWPIYIPFAVFQLDDARRSILRWFVMFGAAISIYFLWILLSTPLSIEVVNKHIIYTIDFPLKISGVALVYVSVICLPMLISSQSRICTLGILALFSAFVAGVFSLAAFISVWCFFAAVISSFIFFIVYHQRKNGRVRA